MARRAALLVAAASLLAGAGASPATATGSHDLGCGQLSPFVNECLDPAEVPYDASARPSFAVLGFVGRMDVRLEQVILGVTISRTWSCEFFGLDPTGLPQLPVCSPLPTMVPEWLPNLIPRWDTRLRCLTSPANAGGLTTLGPAGPWGCAVHIDAASG